MNGEYKKNNNHQHFVLRKIHCIHAHLDLAEFLLDLVRHLISPVLLPQKVPEDPPH